MIKDEECGFYIEPNDIKKQVLTRINKNNLVFNRKYRDETIEKMQMPLFTPYLLNMVYNLGKIPSFIDFFNSYCSDNEHILGNLDEFEMSLKLRLSRAYVSVVRELYIRCFLKKYGLNVKYNSNDDLNRDVDMWVEIDDEDVPVALFLKSDFSRANREHKVNKRIRGIEYIDFEYENNEEDKSVSVYFPYEKDMFNLIERLKDGNYKT